MSYLRFAVSLLSILAIGPLADGSQRPFRVTSGRAVISEAGPGREGNSGTLACTVTPYRSELAIDLRFHFLYEITMPLNQLVGGGDELTIVLRVIPANDGSEQAELIRQVAVPSLPQNESGNIHLNGSFDAGVGTYHVNLTMRDRRGHACLVRWEANAVLNYKDRDLKLGLAAGEVAASDDNLFRPEPLVSRVSPGEGRSLKILINFAPQPDHLFPSSSDDVAGLVSILRNIARDPRITKFSLVAFNLNEQRILYRSEEADQIVFPDLGKAVASLRPGVIEYSKFIDPHREAAFLYRLLEAEVINNDADAVVLVSPKVILRDKLQISDAAASAINRLFYLNYNLNPGKNPWRDAIGRVVKRLHGTEYGISCPHDIWSSWMDAMAHVAR